MRKAPELYKMRQLHGHCGYEPTAVADAVRNLFGIVAAALRGPQTEGPMAPEIALDGRRPAVYVFDDLVRDAATITKDKT
jgi:hypothetical protein